MRLLTCGRVRCPPPPFPPPCLPTNAEFLEALPQNPDAVFLNLRLRRNITYQTSLRSENIPMPRLGSPLLNAPLDVAFVLQYAHNLTVRAEEATPRVGRARGAVRARPLRAAVAATDEGQSEVV